MTFRPHIPTNVDEEALVFGHKLAATEMYLNLPPPSYASQVIHCQNGSSREELIKPRMEMQAAGTLSAPTNKGLGSHYSHPYARKQLNKIKITIIS